MAFRAARGLIDLLVQATLALSGLHTHHGQWRRRRDHATHGSQEAEDAAPSPSGS
ncbi:MAG TPA: hypothetical protein VEL76_31395 [Gemmataceae bacterium]|nr:hypothetical protein [Gemmataceae bacterium]